ncbi:cytochrome c oxidase subunit II [Ammoniphilus resinae]|uniref:Cytochrome aa3 subunit 2 n=1 Tax=Ammoniphilus resinae TaxID=861532 RepID=A0ABS4GMZ6_9BACL|nr:cytochrome c oxidase subunit II [Ammoniphilus resinae]MBP1931650.1 cytochrome c oxidase subunit 2 [Ammoniphilus resinae]
MHFHRYEKYWLIFGLCTLVVFLTIVGVNAFSGGHQPPTGMMTLDPTKVDQTPPFDQPGLKKVDDNTYEANLIAMAFGYNPSKIEVPVGAKVIFNVTSKDVVHSFTIPGTNVNMMITPGHVNTSEFSFDKPGSYLVLCNEYCGSGHHMMQMTIEVK